MYMCSCITLGAGVSSILLVLAVLNGNGSVGMNASSVLASFSEWHQVVLDTTDDVHQLRNVAMQLFILYALCCIPCILVYLPGISLIASPALWNMAPRHLKPHESSRISWECPKHDGNRAAVQAFE